jgi:hypothetical protein
MAAVLGGMDPQQAIVAGSPVTPSTRSSGWPPSKS